MMNSKPDWDLAQNTAYQIANEFAKSGDDHAVRLPIDPVEIIDSIDNISLQTYTQAAKIHEMSIPEFSRYVGSDDGVSFEKYYRGKSRYVIMYNDTVYSYKRTRFTIAHELGHCLLGHNLNRSYDVQEKEANYFAKRLLVPLPLVNKILGFPIVTVDERVEDISSVFEVSQDVANYSLRNFDNLSYIADDIGLCNSFGGSVECRVLVTKIRRELDKLQRNA